MKRLCDLQSALQVFPSSLIDGQQSRPLNRQRKAGNGLLSRACTKNMADGRWGAETNRTDVGACADHVLPTVVVRKHGQDAQSWSWEEFSK